MNVIDDWIELSSKQKQIKLRIRNVEALEEQSNNFTTVYLRGGSKLDADQTIDDIWQKIEAKNQCKQLRYKRIRRE